MSTMPGAAVVFGMVAAVATGALLPVQAGANGVLARASGQPLLATFFSLLASTLVVGLLLVALRPSLPAQALLVRLPAWAWCGGLLGAAFVATATVFAPRLGAAAFVVAVVAGQLLASVAIDSAGVFGYEQKPLNAGRLVGVALVLLGAVQLFLSTPASRGTQ